VSLIMSAVYTEDQFAAHQFWSRLISGGFAIALFVAPFALHRPGRIQMVLIVVGALGYGLMVARFVFESAHWLEWPSIGSILVFVCWIGWLSIQGSRAVEPQRQQRSPQPQI
jgi:hypothetical protein